MIDRRGNVSQARKRRGVSSSKRLAALYDYHLPDYFTSIAEIAGGTSGVVAARESGRSQSKRIRHQSTFICDAVEEHFCNVAEVCEFIGSGKSNNVFYFNWLRHISSRAISLNLDMLFFESVSRAIRGLQYDPFRFPASQPTKYDLDWLRKATQGLQLVTMLEPDTGWRDVERHQKARGQKYSGSYGGRPHNQRKANWVNNFEKLSPEIDSLLDCGLSHSLIGEKLNLSKSTVTKYIRRMDANQSQGLDRYVWKPIETG